MNPVNISDRECLLINFLDRYRSESCRAETGSEFSNRSISSIMLWAESYLSAGSLRSAFKIIASRSPFSFIFHRVDTELGREGVRLRMMYSVSRSVFSFKLNGWELVTSSKRSVPNEYTSVAVVIGSSVICSGAAYLRLSILNPELVCSIDCSSRLSSIILAIPKSKILTTPSLFTKRFSGFRSR